MKYFVTVKTYNSTTKLGRLLAAAVYHRYHQALVGHDEANRLPMWINARMSEICDENKRLKPMTLRTHGFTDGKLYCKAPAQIYPVIDGGAKAFEDKRPFFLELLPVMNDYTAQEGGER